jgi:hypothetical protein
MSWRDKLRSALGLAGITVEVHESEMHPNPRLDADDAYLTQAAVIGRAARIAWALVDRHPMANRIIELSVEHAIGPSLSVSVDMDDDGLQELVQGQLDALMRYSRITPGWWQRLARVYWIEGEVAVRRIDAPGQRPKYGIMPTVEMEVLQDDETGEPVALRTATTRQRWYRVVNTSVDNRDIADLPQYAGDVLYYQHRPAPTLHEIVSVEPDRPHPLRGRSLLRPLVNRLVWDDDVTKLSLKRVKSLLRWFFQAKITGADQTQLDELNRQYATAPATGSIRWTNDKTEWDTISPDLQAAETVTWDQHLRTTIAGGAGHPLHWHGDGGATNLATAQAMAEPSHRMLASQQGQICEMVEDLTRDAIESLMLLGRLPRTVDVWAMRLDVSQPSIDQRDYSRATQSMVSAVAAADAAVSARYLSHGAGQRIIRAVVERTTGIKISEDELPDEPDELPVEQRNPYFELDAPPALHDDRGDDP